MPMGLRDEVAQRHARDLDGPVVRAEGGVDVDEAPIGGTRHGVARTARDGAAAAPALPEAPSLPSLPSLPSFACVPSVRPAIIDGTSITCSLAALAAASGSPARSASISSRCELAALARNARAALPGRSS